MRVRDLIKKLEQHDPDQLVVHGTFDTWTGRWILTNIAFETLFTTPDGHTDLTDQERETDTQTLVIY